MRLGYFQPESQLELSQTLSGLDQYGLSAVWPGRFLNTDPSDEACAAFGAEARKYDIGLGEAGMWDNLLTDDPLSRKASIEKMRSLLRRADLAGVRCVVTLVGSKRPKGGALSSDPRNYSKETRAEFREIVLRILDGLDLKTTRYGIEPWHNSFFYQPEEIREWLDQVDHPRLGVHLDQMNMVSQKDFFNTTDLIKRTFTLLSDRVWSVHLKDIRHDDSHMFLKWDEVRIGDGVMDYDTLLKHVARLPQDTPCYCEHFDNEGDYAICFARLHHLAKTAGVSFHRRRPE